MAEASQRLAKVEQVAMVCSHALCPPHFVLSGELLEGRTALTDVAQANYAQVLEALDDALGREVEQAGHLGTTTLVFIASHLPATGIFIPRTVATCGDETRTLLRCGSPPTLDLV